MTKVTQAHMTRLRADVLTCYPQLFSLSSAIFIAYYTVLRNIILSVVCSVYPGRKVVLPPASCRGRYWLLLRVSE